MHKTWHVHAHLFASIGAESSRKSMTKPGKGGNPLLGPSFFTWGPSRVGEVSFPDLRLGEPMSELGHIGRCHPNPCLHQPIHGSHPRRRSEEVWEAIALLAAGPLVEKARLGNQKNLQLQG